MESDIIKSVEFGGARLPVVAVGGVPFVGLRAIVVGLGLDWSSQRKRISRDPVLRQAVVMMTMPSAGGLQRAVLLRLDHLNGWLFGVHVDRARPELRERLNRYRLECYAVLARHFGLDGGRAADLRARLQQAERDEARSFAAAQSGSRAMNRRRREKPVIAAGIRALRGELQMALALEGN